MGKLVTFGFCYSSILLSCIYQYYWFWILWNFIIICSHLPEELRNPATFKCKTIRHNPSHLIFPFLLLWMVDHDPTLGITMVQFFIILEVGCGKSWLEVEFFRVVGVDWHWNLSGLFFPGVTDVYVFIYLVFLRHYHPYCKDHLVLCVHLSLLFFC